MYCEMKREAEKEEKSGAQESKESGAVQTRVAVQCDGMVLLNSHLGAVAE